jgi:hypothetical protein
LQIFIVFSAKLPQPEATPLALQCSTQLVRLFVRLFCYTKLIWL